MRIALWLWMILMSVGALVVSHERLVSRIASEAVESPRPVPVSVPATMHSTLQPVAFQPPMTVNGITGSPDAFEFAPMVNIQTFIGGGYETIEAVQIGDVTGDGRDDLIVQPYTNVLRVYVQQADGTLATPRDFRYSTSDNYSHRKNMVLADFNGDGVLDVAASGLDEPGWHHGVVNLILSGPGGTLSHRQALTTIERPADHWSALDVDGDGAMDIAASENVSDYSGGAECGPQRGTCPRLRVMYGDGKGEFSHIETIVVGQPHDVAMLPAVDVDGDGLRDLVYSLGSDPFRHGWAVARLRQTAGGLGAPVTLFEHTVNTYAGGLVSGDFTGDGRIDFVAGTFDNSWLYARTGSGSYVRSSLSQGLLRSNWSLAADFDGDGLADYATVQMTDFATSVVLYQQRNGGLTRYYRTPAYFELDKVQIEENALAAGDLNGDGCKDLVVAASYYGLLIFPGRNCVQPQAPPLAICDLRETGSVVTQGAGPVVAPQAATASGGTVRGSRLTARPADPALN